VGGVALQGVRLVASASGPLRRPLVDVEGGAASVRSGAEEIARASRPRPARERGGERLRVRVASCGRRQGRSPSTRAAGWTAPRPLALAELTLAYPGARWRLDHPATIRFAGPATDRLELMTGEQRISVEGGLGARGALDAHIELVRVDLTRLPPGLIPRNLGVAGVLSADARATGTTRSPRLAARFELEGGAVRGLAGLHGAGSGSWDGRARRASATLTVERADGGVVDVSADVPLPLDRSPAAPLNVRIRVQALPVAPVLAAAGAATPLEGILALDATLAGTSGAPRLSAQASLEKGAYHELRPFAIAATLETPESTPSSAPP
jgi:translocation and assembly module TamB